MKVPFCQRFIAMQGTFKVRKTVATVTVNLFWVSKFRLREAIKTLSHAVVAESRTRSYFLQRFQATFRFIAQSREPVAKCECFCSVSWNLSCNGLRDKLHETLHNALHGVFNPPSQNINSYLTDFRRALSPIVTNIQLIKMQIIFLLSPRVSCTYCQNVQFSPGQQKQSSSRPLRTKDRCASGND